MLIIIILQILDLFHFLFVIYSRKWLEEKIYTKLDTRSIALAELKRYVVPIIYIIRNVLTVLIYFFRELDIIDLIIGERVRLFNNKFFIMKLHLWVHSLSINATFLN